MLETLKNIKKDKVKEKVIYILILLVILYISISVIFDKDLNNSNNTRLSDNSSLNGNIVSNDGSYKNQYNKNLDNTSGTNLDYFTTIENNLANILNEVEGVSDISVMITFVSNEKQNPVYNVVEKVIEGNVVAEKEVVYNEENGNKVIAVETVEMPKVEGVMIVGKGVSSESLKTQIISAISSLTDIGIHKVQIFERGE